MNTFELIITTPDGHVFRDQVQCLSLRGADGDLAVMAGHVPLMTSVKPGEIIIQSGEDSIRVGVVQGGLLSVAKDAVTLLAADFSWKE